MFEICMKRADLTVPTRSHLINLLVTGTLPLPREFFISDPNVTNTYIILFYSRFISVYRALEKLPLLFIISSEFNVY